MLRVKGLSKIYAGRPVFRNISFELGQGVYALQGANGVGKSTMLKLLAGGEPPDSGEIWIGGLSLQRSQIAARQQLAYAPDESPIYPFITGADFLQFIGKVKQTCLDNRFMHLVERFGLAPHLKTRFSHMSLGSQKKFLLAACWLTEPCVILCDEPTNGLDASARTVLAALFIGSASSKTILFTSHDAEFISGVAATVLKLESGVIRDIGASPLAL